VSAAVEPGGVIRFARVAGIMQGRRTIEALLPFSMRYFARADTMQTDYPR
jgi:molybdenum cofactor biosynthesis enzyme